MPRFSTEEEHRSIYSLADILLDSYPYNGGTHTLEALWFNLPVVTHVGEQFLSRMGYSFLESLDIRLGVSWSWEEYINWGVKLGQNSNLRQEYIDNLVKSKDSENLAPLWNSKKFAQDLYAVIEKLLIDDQEIMSQTSSFRKIKKESFNLLIIVINILYCSILCQFIKL